RRQVAPLGLVLGLDLDLVDELILVGIFDLPLHLGDRGARLGRALHQRHRRMLAILADGDVGDAGALVLRQVVDDRLLQHRAGAPEARAVLDEAPGRAPDLAGDLVAALLYPPAPPR